MQIKKLMNDLQSKGKKAFIPYITAGDPDLQSTEEFIHKLISAGADIIELGVPFSDPAADGIINQKSAERALKNNVSLKQIIDFVSRLRNKGIDIPIILFTYFNPVLKMGLETFSGFCRKSMVNGVLIVDLPPEAAGNYKELMDKNKIETIFLASPTTSKDRLALISGMSSGFVYYVARTGITGIQKDISSTLEKEVTFLKENIENNICIGFGISNPQQAKEIAKYGDGVIVGSAIVKIIEEYSNNAPEKIYEFSKSISDSVKNI